MRSIMMIFALAVVASAGVSLGQEPGDALVAQLRETIRTLTVENVELTAQLRKARSALAAVPIEAKITEQCLEDCPGCDHWWLGPDPEHLLTQKWQIAKRTIKNPPPGVSFPRWEVCIGNECGIIEYTPNFRQALADYMQQRELRRRAALGARPIKSAR